MHIEKLTASNFGGYTEFEARTKGSVVGLLGPNAGGKTTILQIIEYLLRGEIGGDFKLPMETYLHNFGADAAPSNGEAGMEFRHNLERWKLTRQFGKTSKRSLQRLDIPKGEKKDKWTWTSDSDVQTELRRLFGADLKMSGDIVFLRQGALMTTLFGTPADREEMFVKFLGVSGLSKLSDLVDKRRQALMSSMPDLTKSLDDAREFWEQAERRKETADQALAAIPDFAPDIRMLEDLVTRQTVADRAASALSMAQSSMTTQMENRQAVYARLSAATIAQLEQIWTSVTNIEADTRHALEREAELADLYRQRRQSLSRAEEIRAELAAAGQKHGVLAGILAMLPDVQSARTVQSEAEAELRQFQQWGRLQVGWRAATDAVANMPARPAGDADALSQLAKDLAEKAVPWEMALGLAATLAAGNMTECPVCRTRGVKISTDLLPEIQDKATALRQQEQQALRDSQMLRQAQASWEATSLRTNQALQQWEDQLRALNYNPGTKTQEQLQEALTHASSRLQAVDTKTQELRTLANQIDRLGSELQIHDTTLENLNGVIGGRPEPQGNALKVAHDAALVSAARALGELTTARNAETRFQQAESDKKAAEQAWAAAASELAAAHAMLTPRASGFVRDLGAADKALADLSDRQRQRQEARGAADQAKLAADDSALRLKLLEEQQSRNTAKVMVCEELTRISQVFARQGLPMAYVNYRFGQLVMLTASILTELKAEFMIRASDRETVSFMFRPAKAPDGVWLHQNKFSGAQKVTLCVAFALAMQRLILPKLGFLLLDEPTTHLDEASVELLAGLLQKLGERLRTTHTQVWVSDHHPALVPAFDSIVRVPQPGWFPLENVIDKGLGLVDVGSATS